MLLALALLHASLLLACANVRPKLTLLFVAASIAYLMATPAPERDAGHEEAATERIIEPAAAEAPPPPPSLPPSFQAEPRPQSKQARQKATAALYQDFFPRRAPRPSS